MITFVLAVVNLLTALIESASQSRLIKAGEDRVLLDGLEAANARIAKAIAARRAVTDSVPDDDPYCRD